MAKTQATYYPQPRKGAGYRFKNPRTRKTIECAGIEWYLDYHDETGKRKRHKAHTELCRCPQRTLPCEHERAWRIQNKVHSSILLPKPPIDPPELEVLPIGGIAIVDQQLLDALEGLVEVIDESTGQYCEVQSHSADGQEPTCTEQNLSCRFSYDEHTPDIDAFLTAWYDQYADGPVRASQLLPCAKSFFANGQNDTPPNHKMAINLGSINSCQSTFGFPGKECA